MFYEALPDGVATLLTQTPALPLPGHCFLAGGTAAALYLGHRESVDIDLFTPESFDALALAGDLKKRFRYLPLTERQDTLLCDLDGVRFSLFTYRYPNLEPLRDDKRFGIPLASPLDIALMKLIAIYQRGTAKDFVDLAHLIRHFQFPLADLESRLTEKYGIDRNILYHVRRSLLYFDDAEKTMGIVVLLKEGKKMPLDAAAWEEIKTFFRRLAAPLMPDGGADGRIDIRTGT